MVYNFQTRSTWKHFILSLLIQNVHSKPNSSRQLKIFNQSSHEAGFFSIFDRGTVFPLILSTAVPLAFPSIRGWCKWLTGRLNHPAQKPIDVETMIRTEYTQTGCFSRVCKWDFSYFKVRSELSPLV